MSTTSVFRLCVRPRLVVGLRGLLAIFQQVFPPLRAMEASTQLESTERHSAGYFGNAGLVSHD